jgi:hypothetical protein
MTVQPCVSSLKLDVGCPVIAAAIPDAMLLPTDEKVLHRRFPSMYKTA